MGILAPAPLTAEVTFSKLGFPHKVARVPQMMRWDTWRPGIWQVVSKWTLDFSLVVKVHQREGGFLERSHSLRVQGDKSSMSHPVRPRTEDYETRIMSGNS